MKTSDICRLCLKVCKTNFQPVQEITKKMLEVLLVEMDLNISINPVKCKECIENLQECCEFKSVCILTEMNVIDVLESRHICKINMSEVYLKDGKSNFTLSRMEEVCRFCTKSITKFFSVDKLDEELNFSNMVKKFLPEVTLDFTNNPVCCSNCLNSLKSYFTFLRNCQDVEKHIKVYCKAENITKEKVKLNNVLQYMSKLDIFERNGKETISKLKKDVINEVVETCSSYPDKIDIKQGPIVEITVADIIDMNSNTTENQLVDTFTSYPADRNAIIHKEQLDGMYFPNACDTKESNMIKGNTFEEKPDKLQFSHCNYKSSCRSNLTNHLKSIDGKCLLSCHHCGYKTHDEDFLKKHQVIHGNHAKFKCPECQKAYNTKQGIENHFLLKHENLCDIKTSKIHSCNICSHKTTHRHYLIRHIKAKHSRLEKWQCNYCLHTFGWKADLKRHISSFHLNLKPHICKVCNKTFIQKYLLDSHIVSHHQKNLDLMKTVTNKIYTCDHCTFKCCRNSVMKNHIQTHGDT